MKFVPIRSPFSSIRVVGAKAGCYTFIISYEMKLNPEYRASWKNRFYDMIPFGTQPANYIDGSPFKTFQEAVAACEATYRQLRSKQ